MNVSDLRVMGRATQGVRLINIQDTDSIAAVTKVDHEDEIEAEILPDGTVAVTEQPIVTDDETIAQKPASDETTTSDENTTPTDDNK